MDERGEEGVCVPPLSVPLMLVYSVSIRSGSGTSARAKALALSRIRREEAAFLYPSVACLLGWHYNSKLSECALVRV